MKSCLKFVFAVVFLVITLVFPQLARSNEPLDRSTYTVKVLTKELWNNGVKVETQEVHEGNESKGTIYFPEELEIALRLINQ